MDNNFANNLSALRKKSGLTQEALAKQLFVTRQAVSKWERGETEPDIVTLCAVSRMFDVSLDELLKSDLSAVSEQKPDIVVETSEEEKRRLKALQKKKLVRKMSLFLLFDIAFCCLFVGIVFTACVDVCDPIWIIWFALPVLVPVIFAIRFRNEIGAAWVMYFFPVPFVSGIIYLLIHYLAPSATGTWLAFLLIPLYYAVAVAVTVGSLKKRA